MLKKEDFDLLFINFEIIGFPVARYPNCNRYRLPHREHSVDLDVFIMGLSCDNHEYGYFLQRVIEAINTKWVQNKLMGEGGTIKQFSGDVISSPMMQDMQNSKNLTCLVESFDFDKAKELAIQHILSKLSK